MNSPCRTITVTVFCAISHVIGFAPSYVDITSIQYSLSNNRGAKNVALNASIYELDNLGAVDSDVFTDVYWGAGVRVQMGDTPKFELLAKASMLGYAGASLGPFYGNRTLGVSSSAWVGLGIVGIEFSHYAHKYGREYEFSAYLSFGSILFMLSKL
jgi:hypothetical protein